MVKILIATPIFPPESGGPATYVLELARRLPEHYDVTVLTYADEPETLPRGHLLTVPKNSLMLIRLWRYYKKLMSVVSDVDVVYAQGAVAAGLPAMLAARRHHKPLIVKMVGDEAWERARNAGKTSLTLPEFVKKPAPTLYTKLLRVIQRFVLRRADVVTTPSVYLAELMQKTYHLDPTRVSVNYNATERAPFTVPKRTPYTIAVVNRLTKWKHVDEILKAIVLLKKSFPEVTLTIAGDGPERKKLEALATELGVSEAVTFLGDVPKSNVNELLASSSVYVLNSSYEGLPFTVLEAFAAQIPVVATNIPGTNELVTQETGWPTNSPKAIELATTINEVFKNEEAAVAKATAAYTLLTSQFTWEQHVEKINTFCKISNT